MAQEEAVGEHFLLDLLSPEDRQHLVAACTPRSHAFGDVIIRQGAPADEFFVLVSGRARVVQREADGEETVLSTLHPGEVFGEIALLEGRTRTATVRASSDVTVLRMDRGTFERLCGEIPTFRSWLMSSAHTRTLHSFLKRSTAFRKLPSPVLRDLVESLEAEHVPAGTVVFRKGDPVGPMYVVQSGKVKVTTGDSTDSRNLAFLRSRDVFGELSLLKGTPRGATVEAFTDCELLKLSPEAFHRLEERWPEFRYAVDERLAMYDYQREARIPLDFAAEIVQDQAPQPVPEIEAAAIPSDSGRIPRRRRRTFPLIRQIDEADCGVACLSMICRFHGKRISLTRLRALAHTATDGTTLKNLCAAAEELGFSARPVRLSKSHLPDVTMPAILHWEGDHWVVLVDVDERKGRVRIADPAIGDRWLPREVVDEKWSGYAALLDVTPDFLRVKEDASSWRWLTAHVKPHVGTLLKALMLSLMGAGLVMALPILTQVIVDRVVIEGATGTLSAVLVAMIVAFGFRTLGSLAQGYLLSFVAVRMDSSVLDFLARRLLSLPLSYFQARRSADIQRRLDGARQARQMLVSSGIAAGLAAVQVVAAVTLMFAYSVTLTLLFIALSPAWLGLMWMAQRKLGPLYDELEASQGKYRAEQLDAIKGIEAVKASSAEASFRRGLLERFLSMADKQRRSDLMVLTYQSGVEALSFAMSMLFLWVGAQAAMAGELTLGAFVAFNALVGLAISPLGLVLNRWDDWQLIKVLGGRLQDVLASEPEQGKERTRLLPVHAMSGEIEFRNLTFRYGGPESRAIIDNISLKVESGKTVAIVGRSGSGKTTLIKLLGGLLEPTQGSVLVDGVDIRTLNYHDMRRRMGFVLQDTHLFAGTVFDNITLGLERNLEKAVAAARAANAHDFIERLPLGYETKIGESGLALSGGQKQRVAIARAIYRNPVVLVFDEATSALDAESERAIQENMKSLFEGRTVFVIAHRLSTIRDADWTVVLEQGRVAEQGTHEDLMDRRGIYFYLVSRQVEQ